MGYKFVYRLGFKFEEEYSVISANIPNMPEKENFRKQWLREHPEFAKRALTIKRGNAIRDPEAPNVVVLNEEDEMTGDKEDSEDDSDDPYWQPFDFFFRFFCFILLFDLF